MFSVRGMAGALVMLGVADALLTQYLLTHEYGMEGNVFVDGLLSGSSVDFWLLKIVGTILAAMMMVIVCKRHKRIGIISFGIFNLMMALVVTWNTIILL